MDAEVEGLCVCDLSWANHERRVFGWWLWLIWDFVNVRKTCDCNVSSSVR